jgi:capsular polysaccharide biosynthesis protein
VQDINLYHLLKFDAKKWLWIVIFTAIGTLAGYVYSAYIQTPLYKSDATLLLISSNDEKKLNQDTTLINNYIALLKSRRVLEPVISKQGNKVSYDELAASTTATNEKSTEVIKLSIASKSPQMSKELVDGVVISFKEEIKKLYALDNISIVDNASQSTQPYNIHTIMLMAITTATAFFASLIILFFAYDLSIMKKSITIQEAAKAETKNKHFHQGDLLNKVVAMLIGAETDVLQTPQNPKKIKSAKKNKRKS